MELTEEQKRRMEENRLKAILIRAAKSLTRPTVEETPPLSSHPEVTLMPIVPEYNTSEVTNSVNTSYGGVLELPNTSNGAVHLADQLNITSGNTAHTNVSPKKQLSGSCVLRNTLRHASTERFDVDIGYHRKLIDIFKTIPSGKYDKQKKRWNFSVSHHDLLMEEVGCLEDVLIYPLSRSDVLRCLAEDELVEFDSLNLDPVLANALYPFQKDGVRFGITKKGRLLIADDMGLGKTIQAIAIASYYQDNWPLLVVCPSSLKYTWLEAFAVWLPSLDLKSVNIVNSSKDSIDSNETKVYIMSYSMLVNRKQEFCDKKIAIAILDESHFIKNRRTLRAEAAQEVLKDTKHVMLLSGTPALSQPMDLYTQLHLIDPIRFRSANSFARRYCFGHWSHSGHWRENGALNEKELSYKLRKWVMIRRLKTDELKDLPPKHRQRIFLNPYSINTDGTIMQRYRRADFKGVGKNDMFTYYSETAKLKLPAVRKYIADLLESEEKFVCFAHHMPVLDGVCKTLRKKNIKYIRIDGSTVSQERAELCRSFQQDEDCRVAVLSITTAHTGITLTAAKLVVFAELFWNPGVLIQAEDRVHRIGQTAHVLIQYLVAEGTADDYFWTFITKKLKVLNKIGLCTENFTDITATEQEVAWAALGDADDTQESIDDGTSFEDSEIPEESGDESDCLDDNFRPPSGDEDDSDSSGSLSEADDDLQDADSRSEEVESESENEVNSDGSTQEYAVEEDYEYLPDSEGLKSIATEELQEDDTAGTSKLRRSARIIARSPQEGDDNSELEGVNMPVTRRKARMIRELMEDDDWNSASNSSGPEDGPRKKSRIKREWIDDSDPSSHDGTPSVRHDSELFESEEVGNSVSKIKHKRTNRLESDDDDDNDAALHPNINETVEKGITPISCTKRKAKELESDEDDVLLVMGCAAPKKLSSDSKDVVLHIANDEAAISDL